MTTSDTTSPETVQSAQGARLFFLNLGHTYDHLFILLFPTVVLVLEDEWGRSYEELIWAATVGMVTFATATIPAGWLGDHWNREKMMAVFFFGIGGASVLTGFTTGPWGMAAGLGLIGLFGAIYHPVGIALVVSGQERLGWVLGVNGVWGNMGIALAALTAGVLSDLISWRAAFIVPGLVSIATGCAYAVFLKTNGTMTLAAGAKKAAAYKLPSSAQWRVMFVVIVAASCGGLVFTGMSVTIPKALEEGLADAAISTSMVGVTAAFVFAAASFSQLLSGRLIDRHEARPLLCIAGFGQVVFLALIAMGTSGMTMVLVALGVMLFAFGQIPMNDTLVARYSDERMRARLYSVKYVLTFGVSTSTVPLIAWLRGTSGDFLIFYSLLTVLAALIALSALVLPLARPPSPEGEVAPGAAD